MASNVVGQRVELLSPIRRSNHKNHLIVSSFFQVINIPSCVIQHTLELVFAQVSLDVHRPSITNNDCWLTTHFGQSHKVILKVDHHPN